MQPSLDVRALNWDDSHVRRVWQQVVHFNYRSFSLSLVNVTVFGTSWIVINP